MKKTRQEMGLELVPEKKASEDGICVRAVLCKVALTPLYVSEQAFRTPSPAASVL